MGKLNHHQEAYKHSESLRGVSTEFMLTLPYILTIAALVIVSKHATFPAADSVQISIDCLVVYIVYGFRNGLRFLIPCVWFLALILWWNTAVLSLRYLKNLSTLLLKPYNY